jgi:hypothetical protein
MTATARPSTGGDPTAPTPRFPVGRSAAQSHDVADRRGWPHFRSLVGVDLGRSSAPPPRRRTDRRHIVQDGCEHGGVSGVGRGDRRGQWQPVAVADQVQLASRLATIDGICGHVVPHAWLARSPAPSPAGPAQQGDPRPAGAERRTPRPWPTRSAGASRSPASRSPARGPAGAATGSRSGPCPRSRQTRPIRDGAMPPP